jgi:methylenetetrahydrofolate dehydrogenase (NADP+)/methenyltetrahydrofolate cyclohydrolase
MNQMFDGKNVREEILGDLADKVSKMKRRPTIAVFLIGDDTVSAKYGEIKQKVANKIGIDFCLYKFEDDDTQEDAIKAIEYLNNDPETDGIMIQIPVPKKFDRDLLISKISPEKDVDGLRYCAEIKSDFRPPVVLSILEAIKRSGIEIDNKTKIALIGCGFLVGAPLLRSLKEDYKDSDLIAACGKGGDVENMTKDADIVISATGSAKIIKSEMVKEGAILIDAGTAEENGELIGDIDTEAYKKASYYTPVPGGIGPVTVAMLFKNLVSK